MKELTGIPSEKFRRRSPVLGDLVPSLMSKSRELYKMEFVVIWSRDSRDPTHILP